MNESVVYVIHESYYAHYHDQFTMLHILSRLESVCVTIGYAFVISYADIFVTAVATFRTVRSTLGEPSF